MFTKLNKDDNEVVEVLGENKIDWNETILSDYFHSREKNLTIGTFHTLNATYIFEMIGTYDSFDVLPTTIADILIEKKDVNGYIMKIIDAYEFK